MKYSIIIFLVASSLFAQGQRTIIMIFNDWGVCAPGPIIQEELSLCSDSSFEYNNCHYQNIRIEASGHYSYEGKNIILEYNTVKIDTLNKNQVGKEKAKIELISEFSIARDKEWLENKPGMLYECGKQFRSRSKIFEPRKRRIITTKVIDYKIVNN